MLINASIAYCTGIFVVNSGFAIKGNKYSKLSGEKNPKTEGPNSIPAIISPKTDGSLNFLKSSANNLAIINIRPNAIKKIIMS